MIEVVSRLADALLARVAPKAEASAGCVYHWYICYCSGGLLYQKQCIKACSQVPDHCRACTPTTTC